jgi:hypothetical protein
MSYKRVPLPLGEGEREAPGEGRNLRKSETTRPSLPEGEGESSERRTMQDTIISRMAQKTLTQPEKVVKLTVNGQEQSVVAPADMPLCTFSAISSTCAVQGLAADLASAGRAPCTWTESRSVHALRRSALLPGTRSPHSMVSPARSFIPYSRHGSMSRCLNAAPARTGGSCIPLTSLTRFVNRRMSR